MSTLSIFDEPDDACVRPTPPPSMYESQRAEIRNLFAELGMVTAREQFMLVEELIGVRLNAVIDLKAHDAQRLIPILRSRTQTTSRPKTGDSWADRDEDTWIDKL